MPVDVTAPGMAADVHLVAAFWTARIVYSLISGLLTGSYIALFMDITTPAVAATQFTAYMALANLSGSYTAAWQGLSIMHYGYPITLGLDATVGLFGILLLPWLGPTRTADGRGAVLAAGVS